MSRDDKPRSGRPDDGHKGELDGELDDPFGGPIEMPITDELDLHTFHPRDVKTLVSDYLDECRERGFDEVRIVHGKGVGVLRETVHKTLERHPAVASYRLADGVRGSWGATIVALQAKPGS